MITALFSRILSIIVIILKSPCRLPVGGQAVIEGVLMKGPRRWGLSVRTPDGDIHEETWPVRDWGSRYPWKLPLIRGVVVMVDMLSMGIRGLNRSAQVSLGDEGEITFLEMCISVGIALLAVVGLFILLPLWISDVVQNMGDLSFAGKNIIEGIVRAAVFILYLFVISLWSDIRRVFEYHGAEHKTINAYENSAALDSETVEDYSRIHTRCGTSFLLIVIAVSIIIFSLAGTGGIIYKVLMRVILLPVVIGLSYEIIRGASQAGKAGEYILFPALSLQYLTTREPDRSQIEVAVNSLEIALDPETDIEVE